MSRRCVIVAPEAAKIEAVSKVSALRKFGVVAKVAGQQVGRSRTYNAFTNAARTTWRSFSRAGHQLWLEVTGSIFLTMAAFGGFAGIHEYREYAAGRAPAGRVALAACFTLTFAWFGLTSFWKVRRKNQRP